MPDLIIIGAGISGMTASIYASRYGIRHLIFDQEPGGLGNLAHIIENYPGVLPIRGFELMQRVIKQVESYGVKIKQEKVVSLEVEPRRAGFNLFKVKTNKGEYKTKSLILAMGVSHRHLNIPGEEKFLGRGVSYCISCDAPLFKDKIVAVIGGGDSAVSGAIHLSNFAKKVYLIHRRYQFRAERAWVEKLKKNKKIELILSSVVKEVYGKEKVEGIKVERTLKSDKKILDLKIDGFFIEIGQVPSSALAGQLGVKLDKRNYVFVDSNMKTNVKGVFAAGDLCLQKGQIALCQLITAAATGARAAAGVYQYLTS